MTTSEKIRRFAAEARKFLVALSGAVSLLLAQGFFDGDAEKWAIAFVGFVTAGFVYKVENAQPQVVTDGGDRDLDPEGLGH